MNKRTTFLHNRLFLAVAGVLILWLSYAFGSLAINTGSYWHYLACLVLLVMGVKTLIRSVKGNHGRQAETARRTKG